MCTGVVIGFGTPAFAAHYLGDDSVDGDTICWEDYTQYDDANQHGYTAWEDDISGGVDAKKDDWTCVADLEVHDYSSNDELCGKFLGSPSSMDFLYFNSYTWSGRSYEWRKECTTHEWGHPHGLGDHDHDTYNDEVMDGCPVSSCGTGHAPHPQRPQSHDISDYNGLW
jgi:hypothetical protein